MYSIYIEEAAGNVGGVAVVLCGHIEERHAVLG